MEKDSETTLDVFSYIKAEKTAYESKGVPVTSNWEWHMADHINRSVSILNSKFTKGNNDGKRPNKNIVIPIRNVNVRSEGFDVKNIDLFVDDPDFFHLSLLSRKFYTRWAVENGIDNAIDESVESHFDFGLILAKKVNERRPEIVPLQRIAFCDQTDILSGPICEKHQYSIDQLLDMKGRWYEDAIDMAILQAQSKKNVSLAKKDATTPGKYVEVYELEGVFPLAWLNKEGKEAEYTEDDGHFRQIHLVTFYKNADGKDSGICLFKGKQKKTVYKAYKRTNRYGTACGMGGIEELFEASTWTNYSEIQIKEMLDAATLMIALTTDKKLANNKLSDMKKNQVTYMEEGKEFQFAAPSIPNKNAFDNYTNAWEQHARTLGSASDPALGLNSKSGTPLGETQIVTQQGEGIHEYRQGKIAAFWEEIHRDWAIDYLLKDMNKGDQWLDELSLDELQEVAEKVSIGTSNKRIKEMVLSGKQLTKEEQDMMIQMLREDFMRGGKKQFMKIMKDEFKKLPLKLKFNVAGKQKNMAETVNKLNAVFRTVFANPAILQAPGMAGLFNNILESSGLSPINFAGLTTPQVQPAAPGAVPSPIQQADLATQP